MKKRGFFTYNQDDELFKLLDVSEKISIDYTATKKKCFNLLIWLLLKNRVILTRGCYKQLHFCAHTFGTLVSQKKKDNILFTNCISKCNLNEKACVFVFYSCVYDFIYLPFVDEINFRSYSEVLYHYRHYLINVLV